MDVVPESAYDMEDFARALVDPLKGFLPPPTGPTPARLATIKIGPDQWKPTLALLGHSGIDRQDVDITHKTLSKIVLRPEASTGHRGWFLVGLNVGHF